MNILGLPSRIRHHLQERSLTAKNPQSNDFYLVEYPKSGITWTSCILANIGLLSSNRKEIANFVSARTYIPDIHLGRHVDGCGFETPPVRFIKSHSIYNRNYRFIIYLSREPAQVMASYYRFQLAHGMPEVGFDEFCFGKHGALQAWKNHINSWLIGPTTGQILYLIRYEDLQNDAATVFEELATCFGWSLERHVIEESVNRSSMDSMTLSEERYRSKNPRHNIKFVGAKSIIKSETSIKNEINVSCAQERKLLGYI